MPPRVNINISTSRKGGRVFSGIVGRTRNYFGKLPFWGHILGVCGKIMPLRDNFYNVFFYNFLSILQLTNLSTVDPGGAVRTGESHSGHRRLVRSKNGP